MSGVVYGDDLVNENGARMQIGDHLSHAVVVAGIDDCIAASVVRRLKPCLRLPGRRIMKQCRELIAGERRGSATLRHVRTFGISARTGGRTEYECIIACDCDQVGLRYRI